MLNMKIYLSFISVFIISFSAMSQDVFGKWKTIDGETGEEKSIVEIYKENGKVFGKIVKILNPDQQDALCEKCEGNEKNTPVLGLVLIKDMLKNEDDYRKGTIFDPENGKKYKCRLKLTEDPNTLQVRGYIAFLYATQFWKRVQ